MRCPHPDAGAGSVPSRQLSTQTLCFSLLEMTKVLVFSFFSRFWGCLGPASAGFAGGPILTVSAAGLGPGYRPLSGQVAPWLRPPPGPAAGLPSAPEGSCPRWPFATIFLGGSEWEHADACESLWQAANSPFSRPVC